MDANITADGNSGASQLNAADPNAAVGTVATGDASQLSLSELNTLTGKQYTSKESALKSIKDTFSYVGMKKEDIAKEIASSSNNDAVTKELASIRKDMFYKDNPDYAPYRNLIEKVGGTPAEVVNSAEFKDVFTKAKGYDESAKLKTVLESNPRIASSRDSITKARDLQATGGSNPQTKAQVEKLATDAVKDAFGL